MPRALTTVFYVVGVNSSIDTNPCLSLDVSWRHGDASGSCSLLIETLERTSPVYCGTMVLIGPQEASVSGSRNRYNVSWNKFQDERMVRLNGWMLPTCSIYSASIPI